MIRGPAAALAILGLSGLVGPQARAAPGDVPPAPAGYSAASLYNLGNAHARAGEAALATLAYERARMLAPADPDLLANLAHVRALAGVAPAPLDWLESHGRFAAPDALYWVGVGGLGMTGLCLLGLRRGRARAAWAAGAACGIVLLAAGVLNAIANFGVLSESVVLRATTAGVSPIPGADRLYGIPAASTVTVLDRHAAFELVRDAQGRDGWVASTDLAPVIGREP